MQRFTAICSRYGWRAPVVVVAVASSRWLRIRERARFAWLLLITRGSKGNSVRIGRDIFVTPGGNLNLGRGCYIGDRCRFEIGLAPPGTIVVGERCWLSHDCHIQGLGEVRLGQNVLIGEFVSIRDTTHTAVDPMQPIKNQGDVTSNIIIGDDVWIGRGCLVQAKSPGIQVGRGVIIGANSVVTKSIPPMEVWAGAPARFIRTR